MEFNFHILGTTNTPTLRWWSRLDKKYKYSIQNKNVIVKFTIKKDHQLDDLKGGMRNFGMGKALPLSRCISLEHYLTI